MKEINPKKSEKTSCLGLPARRSAWNTTIKAHAIRAESQRRQNIKRIAAIIESSNPTNTGIIIILKFAASIASDMSPLRVNVPSV